MLIHSHRYNDVLVSGTERTVRSPVIDTAANDATALAKPFPNTDRSLRSRATCVSVSTSLPSSSDLWSFFLSDGLPGILYLYRLQQASQIAWIPLGDAQ